MSWVVNNPIAILAGFLLSAGVLWFGTSSAKGARDAARELNRNERLIAYLSSYAAVFLLSGAIGCVFFAVRFVRWAWYL